MTSSRTKLTPPQYAQRLGADVHRVLGWIRNGELRAVNVATRTTGRPRYRIDEIDIAAFEARRSATPAPKVPRQRKRQDPEIITFF